MTANVHPPSATAETRLGPTAPQERVVLLDVIRGFTLYGVLLANTVPWYSGRGMLSKAEAAARTGTLDEIALTFLAVFISRKSQTLLTCLFGLGFAVQLVRAEKRGERVSSSYMRRLAVLMLIGACHAGFVWWGDVVWGYALTGGALLLFRRKSDRALLLWAIGLVCVPKFVTLIPAVASFLERTLPSPADPATFDADLLAACRGSDYPHLVRMQATRSFLFFWSHAPEYIPWMIGHFLLGYVAGRSRVLERVASQVPLWRKCLVWGGVAGLAGVRSLRSNSIGCATVGRFRRRGSSRSSFPKRSAFSRWRLRTWRRWRS